MTPSGQDRGPAEQLQRVLPRCDALTIGCFEHGLSRAQWEGDLPAWLGLARRRALVAIERASGQGFRDEDQVLAPAAATAAGGITPA